MRVGNSRDASGRLVYEQSTGSPLLPSNVIHLAGFGFDGLSDTIELTHRARDRRGFAAGALVAARWLPGRRGWFTMQDVLRSH